MFSLPRKLLSPLIAIVVTLLLSGPVSGESLISEEWETFLKEKVSFGGFLENTSGLSVSHGSRFFNTSNRFIMNRFTVQPEFNFEFSEAFKLFLSWRFVAEPRYSAETKSREAAVQPAGTGGALPADFYSEYKGVP